MAETRAIGRTPGHRGWPRLSAPASLALPVALLLATVAGTLAAANLPRALRTLGAFRVRRVEVVGTRYLAPHEALAASGIDRESSVFDDPRAWRAALLAHPLVTGVEIERDLPGTIVLAIAEAEPVALARTPELLPVDGTGRVLPIDPAAAAMDLPVLPPGLEVGPDGRLRGDAALALVAALERVRRLEPMLAAHVSEVHLDPAGGLRLLLRTPPGAEALLPADADAGVLRRLRLTLADLVARGELDRVRRVDVRFRDQIVVSLIPGRAS